MKNDADFLKKKSTSEDKIKMP